MNDRDLVSTEAEHGVLGALMNDPELCETVGSFLGVQDFHYEDNGALYSMILGLHSKKISPDPVTLSDVRPELPSGDLTIVYASEIWRDVPSAANGVQYGKIVLERSRARALHAAGAAIMALAATQGKISSQIAEAQQMLMDLSCVDEEPDVATYRETFSSVFDKMEDRLNGKTERGLSFGLPDLDKMIGGCRPGNLIIVAGKPGTGKTVIGTGLCDKIAIQDGKSALIFSLEMPKDELTFRALASSSGVSKDLLESGKAVEHSTSEMSMKVTAAVDKMMKADVRICDKGALSFSRICNIARFQHRAKKLDLIVIDYLTLITSDPGSKFQTRSAEIGSFTRGFKALAKELGIPIIVLAQFNRAMESRGANSRPQMSDLRDSGEIEQDADIILLAYRDDKSTHGVNGITEWAMPKCRHAPPGFCLLQFQGQFQRFVQSAMSFHEYQGTDQESAQEQRPRQKSAKAMIGSLNRGGFND